MSDPTVTPPAKRPWVQIVVPKLAVTDLISLLIVGAFLAAYFREITPDQMMKGALLTAFAASWGFYIGSSRSSQAKDAALAKAAAAPEAVQ